MEEVKTLDFNNKTSSAKAMQMAEGSNMLLTMIHPSVTALFFPIQNLKFYVLSDYKFSSSEIDVLKYFISFSESDFVTNHASKLFYKEE
jgi:hypothetical protein